MNAADRPRVSVIIPTFDRARQLDACLASLCEQTYPPDRFEVVVVDDGSPAPLDDVVGPYASRLNIQLVRQQNRGPAAARNRGRAAATGSLLAFTDDDCLAEPGWLEAFARTHVETPEHFLGGRTENGCNENLYSVTSQLVLDSAYRYYNRDPDDAAFFASSNIAVPANGFDAVGGFSADFRIASEDRDLCDRWRHGGLRLRTIPAARVWHAKKLRLQSFVRQHFNYGRGAFQFHRERARRRAGRSWGELANYPVFLWQLLAGAARQPLLRIVPVSGLLALSQAANAAGFAYAAMVNRRPTH